MFQLPIQFGLAVIAFLSVPQGRSIDRVAWLQGCWQLLTPDRIVEENWTRPRAGSMLAVSRTMRGDSLVNYELVLLHERAGNLAYEAHPSGQPAAVFTARTVTDSMVIFENTAHDFPQRIGYQRRGDSLSAWIEGSLRGQVRRIDFQYSRVPCPDR